MNSFPMRQYSTPWKIRLSPVVYAMERNGVKLPAEIIVTDPVCSAKAAMNGETRFRARSPQARRLASRRPERSTEVQE
jgi:hypothetical protein